MTSRALIIPQKSTGNVLEVRLSLANQTFAVHGGSGLILEECAKARDSVVGHGMSHSKDR